MIGKSLSDNFTADIHRWMKYTEVKIKVKGEMLL